MTKTRALLFLLAFLCGNALAQKSRPEEAAANEKIQAVYRVTDMLESGSGRTEIWSLRFVPERDGSRIYLTYRIAKEKDGRPFEERTESGRVPTSEIRTVGKPTYLREVFQSRPAMLKTGQGAYGHVEEWNAADNSLVRRWPASYEGKEAFGGRSTVFRTTFPDGTEQEVIREYEKSPIFPLRETRIERRGGKTVSHSVSVRQE